MEKNYYDILQVNKNASPEIIEKAYKTLAKKYHPDLQTEENKKQSEEILKEINKSYETLSNPEKRQAYDESLIEKDKANYISTQKKQSVNPSNSSKISEKELLYKQQLQQEIAYQEQLQQARQKAYHDAYIQDLKSRGYRIRYKKSFKDYLRGLLSILAVIFVLFLLWQIPFIQNFFVNLYESNDVIHIIVDSISNLLKK